MYRISFTDFVFTEFAFTEFILLNVHLMNCRVTAAPRVTEKSFQNNSFKATKRLKHPFLQNVFFVK